MSSLKLLVLISLSAVLVACNGGSDDESNPTPTAFAATAAPTVVVTRAATSTATSETLRYTDPKYGYSISFPADWDSPPPSASPDWVKYFFSPNQSTPDPFQGTAVAIIVTVLQDSAGETLEQVANRHPGASPRADIIATRELTVGGLPALEVELDDGLRQLFTYVTSDGQAYGLNLRTGGPAALALHRPTYDGMVASFRFP